MARARLYVVRNDSAVAISRQRLRTTGGRVVARRWGGLAETESARLDASPRFSASGAATVILPPLVVGLVSMLLSQEISIALLAAAVTFLLMAYLGPLVTRRRAAGAVAARPEGAGSGSVHVLFDHPEQATFARAVETADRIAATWPHLGALIDSADADAMLADALWELAGVLARRQELRRLLADLDRPDFDTVPDADDTVRELRGHRDAARAALRTIDEEIARRETSLANAEQAGRGFIREQEMREAIRAAQESLHGTLAAPSDVTSVAQRADAGAELAEQTRTVLSAYRELSTDFGPGPHRPAP